MIQFLFLLSLSFIFLYEARHDYYVIKADIQWHKYSAIVHISTIGALGCISILGMEYFPLIAFYPILRGLIFWPLLNITLDREPFHLSNHFMEKWFRQGKFLFLAYLIMFIFGLIFLIKY